MNHPEFIKKIDWKLLREQKKSLFNLLDQIYTIPTLEENRAIEGIIILIDALQDYSTDIMGLSEEEVFGIKLNKD